MKKLTVTIRAELEIPDDWELVEHPSGILVMKIGDQFVDFDIAPLATRSVDPEAEWSDEDTSLVGKVLDAVADIDVELEVQAIQ
ncbi:MAG: hypothetical protein HGA75_00595 [Thiobacillus sp.]|nr:hypothetical protein [Thiobacillus sp.]